jgi:hypothetical protein
MARPSWAKFKVCRHRCLPMGKVFFASSILSARAFQSFWGGEIGAF